MKFNCVTEYIKHCLPECTRENYEDNDTLIGLPYPYSVPCPDHFQELYYWDTYFLNLGLMDTGHLDLALNNANNFIFLIEKYGFIPNGSRTYYLDRSQPPFFSLIVKDIYARTGDKKWLYWALHALKKEHMYWQTKRMTECGLNQYGADVPEDTWERRFEGAEKRTLLTLPRENIRDIARTSHTMAESGWDFTPRFEFEAGNYVQVDLNSLLFALEKNISYFAEELGDSATKESFDNAALSRKRKMKQLLWNNQKGAFCDYNFVKKEFSPIYSAASFFPLYTELASGYEAMQTIKTLKELEYPFGIVACAKHDIAGRYQWDYPNAWAPIQMAVVKGVHNYGYGKAARRIAEKYVATVEKSFENTGRLWEKYNAIDGTDNVISEKKDKMPVMLGWTAGVYIYFKNHILN